MTTKKVAILRTRFTNSLHQLKPYLAYDLQKAHIENWIQLFLRLTLLHMHFYEFPFQTQNLWEESILINHLKFTTL